MVFEDVVNRLKLCLIFRNSLYSQIEMCACNLDVYTSPTNNLWYVFVSSRIVRGIGNYSSKDHDVDE